MGKPVNPPPTNLYIYVHWFCALTMQRKQLVQDAFDFGIMVSMLNVNGDSRTDILISTSTQNSPK